MGGSTGTPYFFSISENLLATSLYLSSSSLASISYLSTILDLLASYLDFAASLSFSRAFSRVSA
jgi:hypothetical protein